MEDINLILDDLVNNELLMRCRETGDLSNVKQWEHAVIEKALVFHRDNATLSTKYSEACEKVTALSMLNDELQQQLDKAVEALERIKLECGEVGAFGSYFYTAEQTLKQIKGE